MKDKFEMIQEIIQNTFDIFLTAKIKLISLSQTSSLAFPNVKHFEKIVMHMAEDYCTA